MRFKKPKPLSRRKRRRTTTAGEGEGRVQVGFPDFWQKGHDEHAPVYKEIFNLTKLVNIALSKPVKGKLAMVEHYLAATVANSFGVLITLTLNGYGHDAVRIARSMYEASVNAAYLKNHPQEVDDYCDFIWVTMKKTYDYFQQYSPDTLAKISPETIAMMNSELERVASKFQNKHGRWKSSWCKKDLRTRAREVGSGELYSTFYATSSSVHHLDIAGVVSQLEKNTLQVDLAPSLSGIGDALIMGHGSVLHVLDALNTTANLGMDKEIAAAITNFDKVWRK